MEVQTIYGQQASGLLFPYPLTLDLVPKKNCKTGKTFKVWISKRRIWDPTRTHWRQQQRSSFSITTKLEKEKTSIKLIKKLSLKSESAISLLFRFTLITMILQDGCSLVILIRLCLNGSFMKFILFNWPLFMVLSFIFIFHIPYSKNAKLQNYVMRFPHLPQALK